MKLRHLFLLLGVPVGAAALMAASPSEGPIVLPAKPVTSKSTSPFMSAEDIKLSNNRAKRNGDRAWQRLNDSAACRFQAVNNSGGLGNPESVYPSDDRLIIPMCSSWADRNMNKSVVSVDKETKMPMTAKQANFHVGKLPLTRMDRVLTEQSLKIKPFLYQLPVQPIVRLVPGRSA